MESANREKRSLYLKLRAGLRPCNLIYTIFYKTMLALIKSTDVSVEPCSHPWTCPPLKWEDDLTVSLTARAKSLIILLRLASFRLAAALDTPAA